MFSTIPSIQLIKKIEASESDYMLDRMLAIQGRDGNPEGVELRQFGNVLCLYSRTMPWPSFNSVKGMTSDDIEHFEQIIRFYRDKGRKVQFEIVPGMADPKLLEHLSRHGLYQSAFHTSLYIDPREFVNEKVDEGIQINEVQENQFELYATIHCRGTGLSDDGIPYVAANNKVLFNRPGWKFYIAYYNGEPAAAGVMHMKDGTASLTFAATLPSYRNKGLQQALLRHRVEAARMNDCSLVVGQCAFLSQSHRNMERIGMKIGYIRTTWTEL